MRKIKPLTMTKVKNKSRAPYLVFWRNFYSIHSKTLGAQANLGSWFSLTKLGRKKTTSWKRHELFSKPYLSLSSCDSGACLKDAVPWKYCKDFGSFIALYFLFIFSVNSSIRHPGFYGRILNSSDIALITVV